MQVKRFALFSGLRLGRIGLFVRVVVENPVPAVRWSRRPGVAQRPPGAESRGWDGHPSGRRRVIDAPSHSRHLAAAMQRFRPAGCAAAAAERYPTPDACLWTTRS